VHANAGTLSGSTLSVLPESIGVVCNPILLANGADPMAIWSNLDKPQHVGESTYFDGSAIPDPARAPTDFLDLPTGDATNLPVGSVVSFQGVVLDPGSTSPRGASATNAVTLRVL
jgi:hypothetical protein